MLNYSIDLAGCGKHILNSMVRPCLSCCHERNFAYKPIGLIGSKHHNLLFRLCRIHTLTHRDEQSSRESGLPFQLPFPVLTPLSSCSKPLALLLALVCSTNLPAVRNLPIRHAKKYVSTSPLAFTKCITSASVLPWPKLSSRNSSASLDTTLVDRPR